MPYLCLYLETKSLNRQSAQSEDIQVGTHGIWWCFYKKKESGHSEAQREDHVKSEGEDGHQQAKREANEYRNPADTLISDYWHWQ